MDWGIVGERVFLLTKVNFGLFFGTNRLVFDVFKASGKKLPLTYHKHGGGSVMNWEGISVKGGIKLKLMDNNVYHQIIIWQALVEGLLEDFLAADLFSRKIIIPNTVSKLCRNYLTRKENSDKVMRMLCFFILYNNHYPLSNKGELIRMVWPTQSLDLNHIKKIWDCLDWLKKLVIYVICQPSL